MRWSATSPGTARRLRRALVAALAAILPLASTAGAAAASTSRADGAHPRTATIAYSGYAWGSDGNFQACTYGVYAPSGSQRVPVQGLASTTQVAGGQDFALYLQSNGTVLGCGYDRDDELGDGGVPLGSGDQFSPVAPFGLAPTVVTQIAAGGSNGYALASNGQVYAWGSDSQGGLGDGGVGGSDSNPKRITVLPSIKEIAAGGNFAMALDTSGHVWTWGMDQSGEIGNGQPFGNSTQPVGNPYEITGLSNVTSIAAGESNNGSTFFEHALAVSDGTVYAWGADGVGQLGNGATEAGDSTPTAVPITGPGHSAVTVSSVAAGGGDSFAVTSTGAVYAWGGDASGVLGDGTTGQTDSPVLLSGLSSVASVAAGAQLTSALTSSGGFYTWGQIPGDLPATTPQLSEAPIGVTSISNGFGTYYATAENPSSLGQTASTTSLAEGATAQLHATATFAAGGLVPAGTEDATAAASWSSSNTAVATVSSSGVVRAAAASGSTTITASVAGATATSTVNDTPSGIVLGPTRLRAALAGTLYAETLTASGGAAPYSFKVVSGTLPPTFTLTAAGVLSGTPPNAGTTSLTVQVTDNNGLFTTAGYELVVAIPIRPATLVSARLHKSYSQKLGASRGTAPYRWSVHSGKLPPGLKLSAAGTLAGTPTKTGTFSFSVLVTDHATPVDSGQRRYAVTVKAR
jgi:alpha-tubulin suppressor-like RCC1 family protein